MSDAKLLTFQEACAYLQLSDKTLRQLIATGDIRAGKVGGTWRIRQADIDAYFERQCALAAPADPLPASRALSRKRGAPSQAENPFAHLKRAPWPWEEALARDRKPKARG